MYADRRQQPALSMARVQVNYFQRRLPTAASIKATPQSYVCMHLHCSCVQRACNSLRFTSSHRISRTSLHSHAFVSVPSPSRRRATPYATVSFLSFSFHVHFVLVPAFNPSVHSLSSSTRLPFSVWFPLTLVHERALHECTRLPEVRRRSDGIARFLRDRE